MYYYYYNRLKVVYFCQVLSSLPRVVRDVESLGQEASLLKTQMATLMTDVKKVMRYITVKQFIKLLLNDQGK